MTKAISSNVVFDFVTNNEHLYPSREDQSLITKVFRVFARYAVTTVGLTVAAPVCLCINGTRAIRYYVNKDFAEAKKYGALVLSDVTNLTWVTARVANIVGLYSSPLSLFYWGILIVSVTLNEQKIEHLKPQNSGSTSGDYGSHRVTGPFKFGVHNVAAGETKNIKCGHNKALYDAIQKHLKPRVFPGTGHSLATH